MNWTRQTPNYHGTCLLARKVGTPGSKTPCGAVWSAFDGQLTIVRVRRKSKQRAVPLGQRAGLRVESGLVRHSLRYPAVLFDLDGTLINSAVDLVNSVQYALRQVAPDREPPDSEDILVQVGKPLEAIIHELGYPSDPASTKTFVDTYRSHFAQHFNDHTQLYPGVKETLTALRAAGVKLALVTTKHQVQADFTARECGLAPYFDYIHGFMEGRQHKPHPEPVLTAAERLGATPEAAIMVGDTELDIEAGRAAGTATCGVTYGFRPAWFLKSLRPDFLISRISDLTAIVISD